jgi:hypothetical protein
VRPYSILALTILALTTTNACASAGGKLGQMIGKAFDLGSQKVERVGHNRFLVNGVTNCVVEKSGKEKEVVCDGMVILDDSDLRRGLGSDYNNL